MINIRESGCRLGVHLRDQELDVMKKRKTRLGSAHIAVWTTSLKRVEQIVADLRSRRKDVSLDTQLKGLCHDNAHVKRVRCTQGNLHNSKFIVREAGDFETFLLHFIYHYFHIILFPGTPQI